MSAISLENLKEEETYYKTVVKEHDIPTYTNSSCRKDREFNSNFFRWKQGVS